MAAPDYLASEPDTDGESTARRRGLDEPSYYEIALTSKQVLVGFVILLACVVVAFFAGVWVGTSGAAARVETAQVEGPAGGRAAARPGAPRAGEARPARPRAGGQGAGQAAGPGRPAVVAGKPAEDEPPVEEFRFFSENEETPQRPAGGGGPAARPPHRARGEGARPQPGAPPAPMPAAAGAGTVAAETADGPRPPAPAAPSGSVPPQPSAAAAPAAPTPTSVREASPPRPAPATAVAAGRTVVQVFSSTDDDQARKVQQRLQAAGYAASIASLSKDGATLHRVRVGPFPSEAEANRVAAEIKSRLRLDTWVTTP